MKESAKDKRLFVLPVRRVLMAVTISYLFGIFLSAGMIIPMGSIGVLSILIFAWGAVRRLHRKSVLFFVMAGMLLLGNVRAGYEWKKRDMPTQPGVAIEGTITGIEKSFRVRLDDVSINGIPADYAREVIVTLMLDEQTDQPQQPHPGQRVSGTGRLFAPDEKRNPGGVDWRIQAVCKGYELSGYLLPGWSMQGKEVFSLRSCMRDLRSGVLARIAHLFGDHAALFQGIMLGERSGLEEEITAAMRLTGTAHILTVSGLHLSMIAGVMSALLGMFALGRKRHFVILSTLLMLFTGLTGASAGTVRACIMAMIREWARVRSRKYEPLTAISASALFMTLVQPLWLFSASFQFSFFAALGIQLFARSFSAWLAARLKLQGALLRFCDVLSVSMSAQLAAVPMQLMLYGYVPLLSLPMNLICAALMPFLLLGGWFVAAVSVIWMEAAAVLAHLLSCAAAAFEALSMSAASSSYAIVRLPAPHGITVLLVLLMLLLLTPRIRLGMLRRAVVWAVAAMVMVSYLPRFDSRPYYVQLDVGQGDAALFRRGRRAVLVDVGPEDSYDMLRYLRHEGLYVDAVILSHLDADHAGALGVLLDAEVEIPAVITATGAQDREVTEAVRAAIKRVEHEGIALHEVKRGDHIEVNGVSFDVLSPDDALLGSNERSLLLYAQVEGVSFLLAGDLPIESEPSFVPQADVLKVAHHGSRNATSDAFARMASAELAIISVGEGNWYGHPHERVLQALEGAKIMRTDRDGCIVLSLHKGHTKSTYFCQESTERRENRPAWQEFENIYRNISVYALNWLRK